ncbi:MAG: hypothetical protein V7641_2074, partial [Blastocatellia bacterium]
VIISKTLTAIRNFVFMPLTFYDCGEMRSINHTTCSAPPLTENE